MSANTASFDLSRIMDMGQYHSLDTNTDCVNFMFMVRDYMDYLRRDPAREPGWDEDAEKVAAQKFMTAVLSVEKGWPLARQIVPEFRRPAGDTKTLSYPLRFVMDRVAPLLPPQLQRPLNTEQAERILMWDKWRRYIHVAASLSSDLDAETRKQRQEEVLEAMKTLQGAYSEVLVTSDADWTADDDVSTAIHNT